MKILYHHRIASKDGQYVHVVELTEAFQRLGHQVIMVAPAGIAKGDFGSSGGVVPMLKRILPKFVYELMELGYSIVAYRRLRAAVKLYQPDFIYERYNLFTLAGLWIKRKFDLPLLLEVNAPLYEERKKYNGIAIEWLARWSERAVWNGADYVLAVTKVLGERIQQAGVAPERIAVIPNAINRKAFDKVPEKEEAKRRLGLEGRFILGFVGFVRDWHGLDRVIELMAKERHGDWHLLLVGEGPASDDLKFRARELNVEERLHVTGIVGREQVADYVAAFDVALQPGVASYACPLKIYEYLALGRPIVAPATPNIREILEDGKNAILFDPGDPGSFRAAIERLCADERLRTELAKGAHRTIIEKNISWDTNAERVVELAGAL